MSEQSRVRLPLAAAMSVPHSAFVYSRIAETKIEPMKSSRVMVHNSIREVLSRDEHQNAEIRVDSGISERSVANRSGGG